MNYLKQVFGSWENLLLFIPYYFSTSLLLKTLFSPWKREFWVKTRPGFHPEEILGRWASNLLSRLIGAFLRSLMIFAGVLAEILVFLFGLPLLLIFLPIIRLYRGSDRQSVIHLKQNWGHLDNLFKIKPLAADWHFGYTPNLDKYAISQNSKLKTQNSKIIGREKEIAQIKRIFARETENNVLLVGEPGSGRHAIVNYLATTMFYHRFVYFDLVSLFKDKKTTVEQRGSLEEILEEAKTAGNIVLVIDNFEKYVDFADVWEKFIAGSSLYVLALSTPAAYHQILFPNKTLMKYFTKVDVSALSREQVFEVLKNRFAQLYPSPTWVKAGQEAKLPEYDLGKLLGQPENRDQTEQILTTILEASYQTALLEDTHQPEAALDLLEEFATTQKESSSTHDRYKKLTTQEVLEEFLEEKLKVPVGKLKAEEKDKLARLEELLHQRVVNQEEAIKEIANALRRRRLHLSSKEKPIGSFLFLGPTGVGKTETAKALAAIFFENEKFLLRFDMARFQEKRQIVTLLEELAAAIRGQPYAVLLLDEIEKAHHDLLNLFLTILDEGYFLDNHANRVPCQNLIIIGTSNAASEFIREKLHTQPARASQVCNLGVEAVDFILRQNIFSPEFINRFDAVVVYQPLSGEHLKQIAQIKLEKLRERLQEEHKKTFEISEELLEQIVKEGTHPEFGAREIERTIKRLVEDQLAAELLK